MEKIYVVTSGIWYEGDDVIGAFLTEEDAMQACKLEQEQGTCDYIDILIWQGSQRVGRIPYYVGKVEDGDDEEDDDEE